MLYSISVMCSTVPLRKIDDKHYILLLSNPGEGCYFSVCQFYTSVVFPVMHPSFSAFPWTFVFCSANLSVFAKSLLLWVLISFSLWDFPAPDLFINLSLSTLKKLAYSGRKDRYIPLTLEGKSTNIWLFSSVVKGTVWDDAAVATGFYGKMLWHVLKLMELTCK